MEIWRRCLGDISILKLFSRNYESPIGSLGLLADEDFLLEISLQGIEYLSLKGERSNGRFAKELIELDEYFKGERKKFTLKYKVNASNFANKVYKEMVRIPYGKTISYSKLASNIGKENAYRAVGTACGRNKLPIIIPCHRVVAKDGLGGFGGGLDCKRFLLELETN
tara:strand:+ start:101 stop:601 length:501 start_codon:yes stop_codon:yes gene_type:complete